MGIPSGKFSPPVELKCIACKRDDSCRDALYKAFHKSHLLKLRVALSKTAMTDVFREVLIMKILGRPNIVNLIEVIDDLNIDLFYMVHGDIKPDNLLVTSTGAVKIGDFSASQVFELTLEFFYDYRVMDVVAHATL
ncbi:hypothetical protein GIB67_031910 [Kingdonia uniflora]|uniref:Protein kinase domain-containing protein n=1 Tax=Kingdonia uniflora TaxID=39325 RepID=A0A7J7NU48_9MAGN|nr:hypothetical protein GIB67_036213 [Kingdonia uniflora]KAF6170502.1 hypothetical protein GIB67_031910 [Kingdonia uniflora]